MLIFKLAVLIIGFTMKLKQFLETKNITQTEFADALHVSQALVSQWLTGDTTITAERTKQIGEASEWLVTPHDLRPDLYPHPNDGIPEHMRRAA